MNADASSSNPALTSSIVCGGGGLSVSLVVCLFLFVKPSDSVGPTAFWLCVSLARSSLILGVTGLFTGRPYGYSITGIVLSGGILLFWAGLLFLAVLANMIALP